MSKLLTVIFIIAFVQAGVAQQTVRLSKNSVVIKQKTDHLASHAPISVLQFHSREEFGDFISNDEEGFTFYDIDRKANVTVRYDDVRKIKDGYGGYNSVRQTHTDHSRGLIIVLVVVGVLAGVIVAAAAAK